MVVFGNVIWIKLGVDIQSNWCYSINIIRKEGNMNNAFEVTTQYRTLAKTGRAMMDFSEFYGVEHGLGHLKDHELIHFEEKPHSCTYCSKTFRQKSQLTAHERIHTGKNLILVNIALKCSITLVI